LPNGGIVDLNAVALKPTVSMQREKQAVQFGQTLIEYALNRCERKTLAIHVYPDGTMVVDAPEAVTNVAIAAKVKKRAAWIIKQQMQFAAYPPAMPGRRYVSGESVRYLERQYRLLVHQASVERMRLIHGRLIAEVADPTDNDKLKFLVQAWLRSSANAIFIERYNHCLPLAAKIGIEPKQFGFQMCYMSKRWGSCTKEGKIILNPELVAAPKEWIDYVITHELCHLKERNHSQVFYKLLGMVMKDWEVRRTRLNQMVEVRFV